jgi:hypothetical protein
MPHRVPVAADVGSDFHVEYASFNFVVMVNDARIIVTQS